MDNRDEDSWCVLSGSWMSGPVVCLCDPNRIADNDPGEFHNTVCQ